MPVKRSGKSPKLLITSKPAPPSAERPKVLSKFVPFSASKIAHIETCRAAELTMLLAEDKKGNWRPTKLIKNFHIHNPTLSELKEFLRSKKARAILVKRPSAGRYVCVDYATDLHNLAEKEGINCGFVDVTYNHGSGHCLTVFNTKDHGFVFVDFSMLAVYDINAFLGKESKKRDKEFFKICIQPHYTTESGRGLRNIKEVSITW